MNISEIMEDDWIQLAKAIATAAHEGQKRNGGEPYITHPAAIASALEPRLQPIGWLHDTVEDTKVTLDDLKKEGFPSYIIDAVDLLTHKKGDSNVVYWGKIAANPDAVEVKKKDIAHNLGSNPSEHAKQKYAKAIEFFKQKGFSI